MKTFNAYERTDGRVGIRNHVVIINTVSETAGLARKFADLVPGVIPVIQQGGEGQYPEDLKQTVKTLSGIAMHPNVKAALILGLGKDIIADKIMEVTNEEIYKIRPFYLNKANDITKVLKEGSEWLKQELRNSEAEQRIPLPVSRLIAGLQCGGSDAWSGISANPAIGSFSDALVKDEGTSILAETTEAIGAEHILAKRSVNSKVRKRFLDIINNYEDRIKETGEDVRSANPAPGNIAGGLTTLEEKSLGCIKKGGNSPLKEVINYADQPAGNGFIFMDTPGYDIESVSGLAAGGVHLILFSTGKGSPTGSPIVPVIKIGTNPKVFKTMSEHIDINAGTIIDGTKTIDDVGEEIYQAVIDTANGLETAAEKNKNREFAIWRLAETK